MTALPPVTLEVSISRSGVLLGTQTFSPGSYTVGSEPGVALLLADPQVERAQIRLTFHADERVTALSVATAAITWLNGAPLKSETLLHPDDELAVGPYVLQAKLLQRPDESGFFPVKVDLEASQTEALELPVLPQGGRRARVSRPGLRATAVRPAPALPPRAGIQHASAPLSSSVGAEAEAPRTSKRPRKVRAPARLRKAEQTKEREPLAPPVPSEPPENLAPPSTRAAAPDASAASSLEGDATPREPQSIRLGTRRKTQVLRNPKPDATAPLRVTPRKLGPAAMAARDAGLAEAGGPAITPPPTPVHAESLGSGASERREGPAVPSLPPTQSVGRGRARLYLELYWGKERKAQVDVRPSRGEAIMVTPTEGMLPLRDFSLPAGGFPLVDRSQRGHFRIFIPPQTSVEVRGRGAHFHPQSRSQLGRARGSSCLRLREGQAVKLTEGDTTLFAYVARGPGKAPARFSSLSFWKRWGFTALAALLVAVGVVAAWKLLGMLRPGRVHPAETAPPSHGATVIPPGTTTSAPGRGALPASSGPLAEAGAASGGAVSSPSAPPLGPAASPSTSSASPPAVGAEGAASAPTTVHDRPVLPGIAPSQRASSRDPALRVIHRNLTALRACFDHATQRKPELGGQVVLDWTLDERGQVAEAHVKSSSLRDADAEGCMLHAVKSWQFPAPRGGSSHLSYPFQFEPRRR